MFDDLVGYPYQGIYVPAKVLHSNEMFRLTLYCNKQFTHKITSQQTSQILMIQEHWPPKIKMIPEY